jgi:hypothetical protein
VSEKTFAQIAEERIAELQSRRERARAAETEAYTIQQADDMARLVELEEIHGFNRIVRIDIKGWRQNSGAATMLVVRLPERKEHRFRMFQTKLAGCKETDPKRVDIAEELASACVVYPSPQTDKALYDATLELAPGVLTHAGMEITNWLVGEAKAEGKGGTRG